MYIQLEGQILYYERTGEAGENLILLHGNGEDHTIFDELIKAVSDHYCVYAIDSRGQGLSATPSEYHYADMADDLIRFVDALRIDSPTVLGFSDGAIVALIAAASHPGTFKRIIACGANSSFQALTMSARSEIKRQYKKDGSPLTGMMLKEPDLFKENLSAIDCPVHLIMGQHDMVKEKDVRKIAQAIPDSQVTVLPKEDHMSYVIHSDKLGRFLLSQGE